MTSCPISRPRRWRPATASPDSSAMWSRPMSSSTRSCMPTVRTGPVVLADLVPTAGPAAGSPVDYQADDGSQGQFTIAFLDPFLAFDDRYPPPEGSRYIGLEVVATDTGQVPFQVTHNHIYLRDASGNLYYPTTVYRPEGVPLPVLESQLMAPGDPRLGLRRVHRARRCADRGRRPVAQRLAQDHPRRPGGWRTGPDPSPCGHPGARRVPAPVATAPPTAAPPASVAPAPSPTPAASAGTSQ